MGRPAWITIHVPTEVRAGEPLNITTTMTFGEEGDDHERLEDEVNEHAALMNGRNEYVSRGMRGERAEGSDGKGTGNAIAIGESGTIHVI